MNKATSDFEKVVIEDIPLIDVRAPIEFAKGAFKNAVNLPLMDDEERHLVGICYKEKGNTEAVKLGHQLVSGAKRQERINAWVNHLNKYPNSLIYCFRGGQRSQISQQWILEATGKEITRLEGGYKAFRNYLINALNPEGLKCKPILLGGFTGSGKTSLLKGLDNAIDLESIANHRGSTFGKRITPQPTPINFENNLAYALIQHQHKQYRHLVLEDESKNIGKCVIPKDLFAFFSSGQLVVVELPFEERLTNTWQEYVIQSQKEYIEAFGIEQGLLEWASYINNSMDKIKDRLGGWCHSRVKKAFQDALHHQSLTDDPALHKNWIEILLKEYYDPMYNYQLQKKAEKIAFKGCPGAVLDYLKTFYSHKY